MDKFIKYGISNELSNKIIDENLSISSIRTLSRKNLEDKYGFSKEEVKILKESLNRQPIDDDVLQTLLERSAFTCNICAGTKSDAYIVHHIEHYSDTQDNNYANLIVLCPNDHELAHREGEALANKITKPQLIKAKRNWERRVEELKVQKASLQGDIRDIDYINVNRVLELSLQINKGIPDTQYTRRLLQDRLILRTGNINPELYERYNLNRNKPLNFFAMYGSTMLIYHYYEILLKTFSRLNVFDLDVLLNASAMKDGIIGKFCYYVGGVYGRQYKGEINDMSEPTLLHFKRKSIKVEWKVDPMFLASSSATWRIGGKNIFLIYGKIMNVIEQVDGEKKILLIDIRPYAYGLPSVIKDRTPLVYYTKFNYDEYFNDSNVPQ